MTDPAPHRQEARFGGLFLSRGAPAWRGWARAAGVVALCTGVSELLDPHVDLSNIIMVYLAGVAYIARHEGLRVSVAVVVASIFLFDLIFVPPRWGLNPLNPKHFLTFAVMLAVGLLISRLASSARRQAELAEAERVRSTLLAAISHDVRTPLTTIIGAASTLLEQDARLAPAARAELAGGIAQEAQRLHALVSGLLDLTRLEAGAVAPQPEWCPADDLVNEVVQSLGQRLGTHPVELQVPADAIVWCDPRLVERALLNLLDNALRHTPRGTHIVVAVEVDRAEWSLRVTDDGGGLPAGAEQTLFLPFHRGSDTGGGAGLGLAICAAVARVHGGRVEAASQGGGTRVTLHLPQPPRSAPPGESR